MNELTKDDLVLMMQIIERHNGYYLRTAGWTPDVETQTLYNKIQQIYVASSQPPEPKTSEIEELQRIVFLIMRSIDIPFELGKLYAKGVLDTQDLSILKSFYEISRRKGW